MAEHERSGPHRRVERILKNAGISFESEYTSFRPYALDIYLPDVHAAIEIDGSHHSAKRDAKRDKAMMENYGVPTLRMAVEFVEGVKHEFIFALIEKFMADVGPTTERRKRALQSDRMVPYGYEPLESTEREMAVEPDRPTPDGSSESAP